MFCLVSWPWLRCLAVQAVLFVLGFILTSLVGFRDWPEGLLLAGATCGLLAGGAVLGNVFKKELKEETKSPCEASFLGFFKESVGGVLAIALGLGMCAGSRYAAANLNAQVQALRCVGKPAPAMNFASADEEAWVLEDQQGKVVVVEYWSPHCMPCIAALGSLERIQNQYGEREDFELVSVSLGDKSWALSRHMSRWPILSIVTGWFIPLAFQQSCWKKNFLSCLVLLNSRLRGVFVVPPLVRISPK